jgi:hypothetical protein
LTNTGRAAPQHFEVVANGGKGPFMSIDTRAGSMRNWAAFRF